VLLRNAIVTLGLAALMLACPPEQVLEQAESDIEGDENGSTTDAGVDIDAAVADAGGDPDTGVECEPNQVLGPDGNCYDMCGSDEDCDEGFFCMMKIGVCVPEGIIPPSCDPDTCPPDYHCPQPGSPEDPGTGECVPDEAPPCTDESCPPGYYCEPDLGQCLPEELFACEDGECPPGYDCEPNRNLCVPEAVPACEEDSCPPGYYCPDPGFSECVPDGTIRCDPASCPPGYYCPERGSPEDPGTGECVPRGEICVSDDDCLPGQGCVDGACEWGAVDIVATCEDDADCPLLMTCAVGVCVGCIDDLQCALQQDGSRCVQGVCLTADLGPVGECLTTRCDEGQRCNPATGQCEPTCADDADCAAGETCVPLVNTCVAEFSCEDDADCAAGLTCSGGLGGQGGLCIGCSDVVPCPPGLSCMLTACVPDITATACDSVTCGEDQLCDPADGSCYRADGRCEEDVDCSAGQTCNMLGLCSGCAEDSDCRPEQSCIFGACISI